MVEMRHSNEYGKKTERNEKKENTEDKKIRKKVWRYYTSSYTIIPDTKLNIIQPLNNRKEKYILLLKKDNFHQFIRSQI